MKEKNQNQNSSTSKVSRPTSKDVAALANVAQSTVSYVMNGSKNVAPATARKVREAMKKLGYEPHAGARNLRLSRTHVLALAVRFDESVDLLETVPYIKKIIDSARRRNYDVVLSTLSQGPGDLQRLASRAICDAIILMDVALGDERVEVAKELNVPVVLVGRPGANPGMDNLDFDSRKAAEQIVQELAGTGHNRVVMIGEVESEAPRYRFIDEFYDGLKAGCAKAGLVLQVLTRASDSWEDFVNTMDKAKLLLAGGADLAAGGGGENAFTGVGLVCRNAKTTDWLMRYLQYRRIEAGTDVSVVSYCPDEVAISYSTPVSNVAGNVTELCDVAVEMTIDRLADPGKPVKTVLLEPMKIQRRATTCLNR